MGCCSFCYFIPFSTNIYSLQKLLQTITAAATTAPPHATITNKWFKRLNWFHFAQFNVCTNFLHNSTKLSHFDAKPYLSAPPSLARSHSIPRLTMYALPLKFIVDECIFVCSSVLATIIVPLQFTQIETCSFSALSHFLVRRASENEMKWKRIFEKFQFVIWHTANR